MPSFSTQRTQTRGLITIRITADNNAIAAIRESIRQKPLEMRKRIRQRFIIFREQLRHKLSSEPPLWTGGKRRWNSERQRRAYFATNGFGKGIPYHRTHRLSQSWNIFSRLHDLNGEITVLNPSNYAAFVVGDFQQLMHQDTGWQNAPQIISRDFDTLVDQLIEDWRTVIAQPPKGSP